MLLADKKTWTGPLRYFLRLLIMLTMMVALAPLLEAKLQMPATGKIVWYNYEPEQVTLTGKMLVKLAYGRPNYGENSETDEKEYYPVLVLDAPINVKGNPADFTNKETVTDVREMHLVLRGKKDFVYKNKRVKVTGTLFHAITGHHHTDVLMSVEKIALLE
jgi:hypothetical protein